MDEMQPEDKKVRAEVEAILGGKLSEKIPEASTTRTYQARALARAKTLEKAGTDAITQYMNNLENWVKASPSIATMISDERVMVKYIKDLYEALKMIVNSSPWLADRRATARTTNLVEPCSIQAKKYMGFSNRSIG